MKARTNVLLTAIGVVLTTARGAQAGPLLLAQIVDVSSGFVQKTSSTAPLSVSSGGDLASATFFSLGARADSLAASAESDWFDQWTVSGGSGTGTITVDWSLDGTLTDSTDASCVGASVCSPPSVAYVSLFGATSIFSGGPLLTSVKDVTPGTEPVSTSGFLTIPFTYGVAFDAGFRLEVSAGEGGVSQGADFSHTGLLTSIVLPAGASLTTASGADVPTAPVPEPGTLLLVGTGAATGASRLRRRRVRFSRLNS